MQTNLKDRVPKVAKYINNRIPNFEPNLNDRIPNFDKKDFLDLGPNLNDRVTKLNGRIEKNKL